MGFASCCKECSCWCFLTIFALVLLIDFCFLLNDMSLISEEQAFMQQVINTPVPQLNCLDVCESWYSQEKGAQCCDRYNMNMCVAKEKCKMDFMRSSEATIKALQSYQLQQILVASICVILLVLVVLRMSVKEEADKVQLQSDNKMVEMIKAIAENIQLQKKQQEAAIERQKGVENRNQGQIVRFPAQQPDSSRRLQYAIKKDNNFIIDG